jgi:hypothetical protein
LRLILRLPRWAAFDIYKELVEINTVTTGRAADAMAARLRAAGFSGNDY